MAGELDGCIPAGVYGLFIWLWWGTSHRMDSVAEAVGDSLRHAAREGLQNLLEQSRVLVLQFIFREQ